MKVLTVLGTRPEIIRLSLIVKKLDTLCDHVLVHTGQNYDPSLSDVFFRDLGLREANYHLEVGKRGFAEQVSEIILGIDRVLDTEKPDRVLILGDTNSGLAAVVAKRKGIPVYHIEAGNRCYNDRVPEEVNRRIIDQCSDVLMPYTERSRDNLLREGFASRSIFVVGNPIAEVIKEFSAGIEGSSIHDRLKLRKKHYFLVTIHRAETVDDKSSLTSVMGFLEGLRCNGMPVLCGLHPHTRQRMQEFGIDAPSVTFLETFNFFDFVALEREAYCVISDSGTVQEECCILGVPLVIARDATERPETIECGGSMLGGTDVDGLNKAMEVVTTLNAAWVSPPEYRQWNMSDTVVKIILGK